MVTYLREKLEGNFDDSMPISQGKDFYDLVTMREWASEILHDYFKSVHDGDEESQNSAIINTAAKLLKSDIKTNVSSVTDQNPSSQSLRFCPALDYLPMFFSFHVEYNDFRYEQE